MINSQAIKRKELSPSESHGKIMQNICKITDFGADGSGRTLSTDAITDAIKFGEGGTVIFPSGVFVSGSLELRDDTIYRFEKGCVLRAAELSHFAPIGYKHNEMNDVTSFLWATQKKNIMICGEGVIDFGASQYYNRSAATLGGQMYEKIVERMNQPIFFDHCENISVTGVKLTNSPCWTLTFSETDGVKVENIVIENDRLIPNSDGIHLSASRNVRIRDCRISGGDDSVALTCITNKSGVNRNIMIENCELSSNSAAVRIGHNAENVKLEHIKIHDSNRGIGIFTANNTKINNIEINDVKLETRPAAQCWWGNGDSIVIAATQSESRIGNITISDVSGSAGNGPITFGNGQNIDNISINNMDLSLDGTGNHMLDLRPYHCEPLENSFIPYIIKDSKNVFFKNVRIKYPGGYSDFS